ncbi:polyphosphate kinase 2 family protein [Myxosarcina sp. GI1]|uniref:polyphosphate kinase 2 family protein n=1 Tax=Myxosarcina sp. GI1 TaxID=1541065 RepID=UPI00056776DE|nr:polyphosphate kinase 2 family protein [Myxosarcina sp. GI1]
MKHEDFIVAPGTKIALKQYDSEYIGHFKHKSEAKHELQEHIEHLTKHQEVLYAQNTFALLIVFQAMDAAGKDSTIKYVMSGVNPQGCQVFSFRVPSAEELDHDYLWRYVKALPERGRIGIFNRSYYEEVLVVRVHPELLNRQQLPPEVKTDRIWESRFEEINNFEKYLSQNGIIILKFFLNVSKEEQKSRFLDRINRPEKNWKFSDIKERAYWDKYMHAYEELFNHTSTVYAPWYIIPADRKWFTRLVVADIICNRLASLKLSYPKVSEVDKKQLLKAKEKLENN